MLMDFPQVWLLKSTEYFSDVLQQGQWVPEVLHPAKQDVDINNKNYCMMCRNASTILEIVFLRWICMYILYDIMYIIHTYIYIRIIMYAYIYTYTLTCVYYM